MVYAIVCFATLFSFVGTVLGGIWADQSWGRFWGWDPKENGALIIVLWNAMILHARWGGMIRERGLMNCAIVGNIVTSWSWFGVNMLGIGLHAYGFMDAAFKWLMLFNGSQVALIVLGCLPLTVWKSFQTTTTKPPTPPQNGKKISPAPAV
jgi:cytochrome c biogenesis factor